MWIQEQKLFLQTILTKLFRLLKTNNCHKGIVLQYKLIFKFITVILINIKKQISIMWSVLSVLIKRNSNIQSNCTEQKSLTEQNNTKSTSLPENSKTTYIIDKPQQQNMKQNNLIQIESRGIVKITNNSLKIIGMIEIAEMLRAEPIISSIKQVRLTQEGKPRELCKKPRQPPFSGIGYLFMRFNSHSQGGYGTAFLIKDDIALTAAHNIYNLEEKNFAVQINLIMDIHQQVKKSFGVKYAYVPKEYREGKLYEQKLNYDFAILILEGSEELTKRSYSKIELSSDVNVNDKIAVYGYPFEFSQEQRQQIKDIQSSVDRMPQQKYLFGSQDKVVQLKKAKIFYGATTSTGNSGSPILRFNQSSHKYEAVGIHTTGNINRNSGVRITSEVLTRIRQCEQVFRKNSHNDEKIILIDYQIVPAKFIQSPINERKISITPDITTYAWKENKYRQDRANRNVCIYQDKHFSAWLCSAQELCCDGECVFTIKVHKISKNPKNYGSDIRVGIMESKMKGEMKSNTRDYCVYLNVGGQKIWEFNEQKNNFEQVKVDCECQLSLPCLIKCHYLVFSLTFKVFSINFIQIQTSIRLAFETLTTRAFFTTAQNEKYNNKI